MADRMPQTAQKPVIWMHSAEPVDYTAAVAFMEQRAAAIAEGGAHELVWTLEHPALYTAGTSARPEDLTKPGRFLVYTTGRGGQYTYHGPGQRVAYVMLDMKARGGDVRAFVASLEAWLITALATLGVTGGIREGRVGVWVDHRDATGSMREDKIAALGIRVRRGVSYHDLAERLAAIGVQESEANIANKISRGGFSAVFLIQCLDAIGAKNIAVGID